jgi:hypothetical protein
LFFKKIISRVECGGSSTEEMDTSDESENTELELESVLDVLKDRVSKLDFVFIKIFPFLKLFASTSF